ALTGDFDNDGWPDIYVACDSTPSILYRNNRDGTFTDIAISAGCAYNEDGREQAGMGSTAGDFNCDGWLDIFKTNFSDDTCSLYRNNGDGSFNDATTSAGLGLNTRYLGWGCGFVDLDNDGWLDIFVAHGHVYPEVERAGVDVPYKEPKIVYRNLRNGHFEDVSSRAGPGVGLLRSARGVALGDFDNDGDVDAVINNVNDVPTLLRNDLRSKNRWLKMKTASSWPRPPFRLDEKAEKDLPQRAQCGRAATQSSPQPPCLSSSNTERTEHPQCPLCFVSAGHRARGVNGSMQRGSGSAARLGEKSSRPEEKLVSSATETEKQKAMSLPRSQFWSSLATFMVLR